MKNAFKPSGIIISLFFAGILFLLSACASTSNVDSSTVAGEYLIKLKQSAQKSDIEKTFSSYKIVSLELLGGELYKFKIANDPGYETLKQAAEKSGKFEYIDPDYVPTVIPPKTK
ncbi:MAG: hypothetical protein JW864_19145 [Spirochaetes bacterium]|nr:hypothetical protein [Spirochaetota bacterium]